ncbi:hypothetical protein WH47_04500, partial [Habropoda laboriosa]
PIIWPARSPDLDLYLREQLKSLVYNVPVNNVEELRYLIEESCRRIQATPGILERVRRSAIRRFEQFL